MTANDFIRSAELSAPYLTDETLTLGEKIYYAVAATHKELNCNTNLGIILVCAPLLHACQGASGDLSLRTRLARVLEDSTQADARWTYRAIRMAAPAGLGEAPEQDVREEPTITLKQVMAIASDRDRIAWQYTNTYADIFDFAIIRYHSVLGRWGDESWAAVAVYVDLLRNIADSHIERKYGNRFTRMVKDRMALLHEELCKTDRPEQLKQQFQDVDREFKSAGINPGTTADLTVATLLAVRLELLLGTH